MARRPPPRCEAELRVRAEALAGHTLGEVADALGWSEVGAGLHAKGKIGELLERALGAAGGGAAAHDFPSLGVELKSVPVDDAGTPRESTYVCTLPLADVDCATWATSWVRAKLARVLWVPVLTPEHGAWAERRVGAPLLWSPTPAQEAVLRADFEAAVGLIGAGGIEDVTAHAGRWLQVRPKAPDGQARAVAYGPEGEPVATVPRGFYLRRRFTAAILRDPAALPGE
ncbi:MAG: DNA mismatch repair endonuclease MutH [Deltaproteobacteria bacterium]|nr:DNA mismatch repair endonuclease MutH [Deltaproteobacteria bacterium]